MSKNKFKKNTQSNFKIFESIPKSIVDQTKKKIGNFYQKLKKDRVKKKLRIEKEKKILEKKECLDY